MANLKLIFGILLVGLLIFTACEPVPPPYPQCIEDGDCNSGEICADDVCVENASGVVCENVTCETSNPDCWYEMNVDENGCEYCGVLNCPEQPVKDIIIEAEDGQLTAPMQVDEDAGVTHIFTDTSGEGLAVFDVNILKDGNYKVIFTTKAIDTGKDSFFVDFNSNPAGNDEYVYDVPKSNFFEEYEVRIRGPEGNFSWAQYDPMLWNLKQGKNTLYIAAREHLTRLDKIRIVYEDSEGEPECGGELQCTEGYACVDGKCVKQENVAPTVYAGSDFSAGVNQEVQLNGSVTDDGLPNNKLTNNWIKIVGPGEVIFQNPNLVDTDVIFKTAGTYVLQLTANDGEKSTSDEVTVTVTTGTTEPSEKLKIISATQNAEYQEAANPIENSYDDDLQTRWAARPIPSEITFDLGDVKQVGETQFLFYDNDQGRVYQYSVDVSTDNTHWTPVVAKKSSNEGFTIDTFTPLNARYIKLNFISQNQGDWAGLYEAEIWSSHEEINPSPETSSTDLYGTKTKYSCDYYASPTGTGNGLSKSSPFKITDFWSVSSITGKTLCLMNGTYTGMDSMIHPPEHLSGAENNPIRIVALYDGKAFIDGEGVRGPIYLHYNDWFVIEGIDIFNADQQYEGSISSSTSYVKSSKNIIYRRVVAWDSGPGNTDNFATDYSKRITYEDVGSFGQSRKLVGGGHRSNDYFDDSISGNRVRRAWGRLEKNDYGGEGGMSVGYNTNGNIIENSIVTVDGTLNNLKHEGSSDSFGFLEDRQWDQHNQILGSIAYKTKDQKIWGQEMNSYLYADSQYMTTKDMLIFVEGTQSTFGTNLETTARLNPYHWDNFTGAEYLTFIGGPGVLVAPNTHSKISHIIVTDATWNPDADVSGGRRVPATGLWSPLTSYDPTDYVMAWNNHKNWNVEPVHYSIENPDLIGKFGNLLQYGTAQRPMVDGQPVGAQIACRYENGVLTNKPLWPWPMEERIRVATCMYDNGMTLEQCENDKTKGVQVTKTVFELGGGHVPDFEELNPILCPGN